MRLVDADALEKKLHELALDEWKHGASTLWSNAYLECEDVVYNAQTVDAVEVVRCKGCRWGREACGNIECSADFSYHGYEWFCPNGERREDGRR